MVVPSLFVSTPKREAVYSGADAELRLVLTVVDQLSIISVMHLPYQPAVQEQLVKVFFVTVLPRYVMPLSTSYSGIFFVAHNTLGPFPRMEVFPGVVGTLKMHAGRPTAVGGIVIRDIQLPYALLRCVIRATNMSEIERFGATESLRGAARSYPCFNSPFFFAGSQVMFVVVGFQTNRAVLAMPGLLRKTTFPSRPRRSSVGMSASAGQG